MGGAASPWATPDYKSDPREIFNKRLYFVVGGAMLAGCFYGFDTGNIGGVLTLPSFKQAFGFSKLTTDQVDARKGNIAAMLAAGGSLGALLAAPVADFFGRKAALLTYGIVFLAGAVMQEFPNLPLFMAGRFIAGLAVGATSTLTPTFLSEWSPRSIRGSCTALYNTAIITCLALAFWINYGVSRWHYNKANHSNKQWQFSLGVQLIPGAIFVTMIAFAPESSRYLISHNKREQGLKNLCKVRKLDPEHPYLATEYREICAQVDAEQEIKAGHSFLQILKDIFLDASNRRRFTLAVLLFLFHKLTGTDSINYFAPEIFQMIGVKGTSTSLLTTGVYGIVKLAATLIYVGVIIDRVGRRVPLMIGATLQATAMMYLGLYVRFDNPANHTGSGVAAGGIVGIVWVYIYAVGWSIGHSVAPYVVAAEIFPSRIRSTCIGFCLFVNWIVDYGITKATPSMMTHMGYGTFIFFGVCTYVGVVWIFFCLPELKGRSIESMDDLFSRSLWTMWKHAYPAEEDKIRHDVAQTLKLGDIEAREQGDAKYGDTVHIESR
ncbi:H(+)/hexose cotransporter 1 [Tricladium varicosporioides]|nr:H(+)/hexose cotransporter 1 [Hymenoscyphus varicosporioides]